MSNTTEQIFGPECISVQSIQEDFIKIQVKETVQIISIFSKYNMNC